VQRIEEYAFYYSGLETIMIPSSVEYLSKSCFLNAVHFHQFHLRQGPNCNELKNMHFTILDWKQL
jgi:hypothetical protein